MSTNAKFWDAAERVLWTAAEAGGAAGVLTGYQALPLPNVPHAWLPLALLLVAAVLAGIKVSVAQKFGLGTAATLPLELEPVPAQATQGDLHPAMAMLLQDPDVDDHDGDGDGRDDNTGRFVPRAHA